MIYFRRAFCVAVAAFDFAVVPRCARRDELVTYPRFFQRHVKRTRRFVTDVFVRELRAVICLDDLDFEREHLTQQTQEFYRVFRRVFLKSEYEPRPCAFVFTISGFALLFLIGSYHFSAYSKQKNFSKNFFILPLVF
jgi:hypothetical protein